MTGILCNICVERISKEIVYMSDEHLESKKALLHRHQKVRDGEHFNMIGITLFDIPPHTLFYSPQNSCRSKCDTHIFEKENLAQAFAKIKLVEVVRNCLT